MLSLNLKLCLAVSRGGMVYEKPFKDILWSLIFRNCPNYVTKLQIFSYGWNLFFSNEEFNAVIEPGHLFSTQKSLCGFNNLFLIL